MEKFEIGSRQFPNAELYNITVQPKWTFYVSNCNLKDFCIYINNYTWNIPWKKYRTALVSDKITEYYFLNQSVIVENTNQISLFTLHKSNQSTRTSSLQSVQNCLFLYLDWPCMVFCDPHGFCGPDILYFFFPAYKLNFA